MTITETDKKYLALAIELARKGVASGQGGPFGAVIVKDGEIIGQGHNRVLGTHDPSAHAEIVAIRDACAKLQDFQLTGCTLYSSCEPCPMCLGAIYWARPARLVFAAGRQDAADVGFDDEMLYREVVLPIAERQIPTGQYHSDDCLVPFQDWREKADKELY